MRAPATIPGGHVILRLRTKAGELDCAAYEPSKEFRGVVRLLVPGDRLVAFGELRERPRTLNLEKIEVVALAEHLRKVSNPACPDCGKAMGSMGRGGWFRCKRCGRKGQGGERSALVPRRFLLFVSSATVTAAFGGLAFQRLAMRTRMFAASKAGMSC